MSGSSRDRGGAYADGARQGAPDAIQVADRFHLIRNLGEALERLLDRYHAALRTAARAVAVAETAAAGATAAAEVASPTPVEAPSVRPPTRTQREMAQRHARREVRYDAIHALLAQGLSLRADARHLGLGRDTVRRLARATRCPHYRTRATRSGVLAPHEAYLRDRWMTGERNAAQRWRELRERGFAGSPGLVRLFLARWRDTPGRTGPRPRAATGVEATTGRRPRR